MYVYEKETNMQFFTENTGTVVTGKPSNHLPFTEEILNLKETLPVDYDIGSTSWNQFCGVGRSRSRFKGPASAPP